MAQPIWLTNEGSIGTFPYGIPATYQLSAQPVLPAVSLTYKIITGSLPNGLTMSTTGLISGTPSLVTQNTTSSFTVRATDNLGNIRDRTFSMMIYGSAIPHFTTPQGSLFTTLDSIWLQFNIGYINPDIANPTVIEVQQGTLPPGLQISANGLIQGYANPPVEELTLPEISTVALETTTLDHKIYVLDVSGMIVGRPVKFTGTVFGDIVANKIYYVKDIDVANNSFTISVTQFGDTFPVVDGTGGMFVTLLTVTEGQPVIRTYEFTLVLNSPLGGDLKSYSITVINQETPVSQGGPGNLPDSRIPTILNTRPLTIEVTDADPYYGYYVLPPVSPSVPANIGTITSDNYFAFKVIGYDFDADPLEYSYTNLPSWLTGDPDTGWITGYPILSLPNISEYNFQVSVRKAARPAFASTTFNYGLVISKDITGIVKWITTPDLGTIFNGTVSIYKVVATSDTPLMYQLVSGTLPPNLTLLPNGEITGYVAYQPTDQVLSQGDTTTFTFTVQAYSPEYPLVKSNRTFTVSVLQKYTQPTDTLYMKATPSIQDRLIIDSLLTSESLIPANMLYRPDDQYFGKATSVIYEHAYGIDSNDIDAYLAAVTRNHYWRNITLGEIKTAVAKNEAGEIIYEVVYSEVIDNLINPQGVSIPEEIFWPRPIDLGLGPWYTSVTDIFTSYEQIFNQQFYTSLTPGYARILYPNSLPDMRARIAQTLGQQYDSNLLPAWMTSQQANGSTLGYTQAWVICYTKPGYAETIKANIDSNWPHKLNQINFKLDRFSVNKSMTYNYDVSLDPNSWTSLPSATPVPDPLDSKDFYVLFPRQTILPDETQY